MSASILLVEDEANLRTALTDNLVDEGYRVEAVPTVAAARAAMAAQRFDLLILDIMLPDGDGYSLCRELRRDGVTSMVLMLTARTLEEDLVRGFEAGAQDYLGKPYRLRELLARVGALVRRTGAAPPEQTTFSGFTLNTVRRTVTDSRGQAIDLTRTEFDLLAFLLRNSERALTRDEILDAVWGRDVVVDPRTVDNFVSNLKRKLAWSNKSSFAIQTVRGVGYRLELYEAR